MCVCIYAAGWDYPKSALDAAGFAMPPPAAVAAVVVVYQKWGLGCDARSRYRPTTHYRLKAFLFVRCARALSIFANALHILCSSAIRLLSIKSLDC